MLKVLSFINIIIVVVGFLIGCSQNDNIKVDPKVKTKADNCLKKHGNNMESLAKDPECSSPEIISSLLTSSIYKSK